MTGLLILKQTFATSNILKQKKRENAEMESTQTGILETERQKKSNRFGPSSRRFAPH